VIEMRVAGLALDPGTQMPIVILRDDSGEHTLPIWLRLVEASAIAMFLERIPLSRPMTHDLIRNLLGELGASVTRVEITELRENTFYALIHVQHQGVDRLIDARPSDAVALALRANAPILVSEEVLAHARRVEVIDERGEGERAALGEGARPMATPLTDEDRARWVELFEKMAPDQFGKYKM